MDYGDHYFFVCELLRQAGTGFSLFHNKKSILEFKIVSALGIDDRVEMPQK